MVIPGRPLRGDRRGAVLFIVMLTLAIALMAAASFLTAARTGVSTTVVMEDFAASRAATDAGVAMVLRCVREHGTDELPPDGLWIDGLPLCGAVLAVEVDRPETADLGPSNPSFEQQAGSLAQPLLNPPMSGAIGGWTLARTALVHTGVTVPSMGIVDSGSASDGSRVARAAYTVSVSGTAVFSRDVGGLLEAGRIYSVEVDILASGLPLMSGYGVRIVAGGALVASTDEALLITDALPLDELLADAGALLDAAALPATLRRVLVGGGWERHTLTFASGGAPPAGPVRIELFTELAGLLCEVRFDNVSFTSDPSDPWVITATAVRGDAAHRVRAEAAEHLDGSFTIDAWEER